MPSAMVWFLPVTKTWGAGGAGGAGGTGGATAAAAAAAAAIVVMIVVFRLVSFVDLWQIDQVFTKIYGIVNLTVRLSLALLVVLAMGLINQVKYDG